MEGELMHVDAIVLAGGHAERALARLAGTDQRALIPFEGKPFIVWVLEALRGCAAVERIAVVGPEALRHTAAARLADLLVPEGHGIYDNFWAGVEALHSPGKVLVTASDNPLLTTQALEDFLTRCPDVDICYPILRGEVFREAFPGSDNILIPLRDGKFIGASCMLFDARALPKLREAVARVFAARKSYGRMVGLLGVGFTARFLLRRVTVAEIEQRVGSLTGCHFSAVPDCDPVLAIDIDAERDLEIIRPHPRHREGAQ
jgi:hypothetical protein